MSWSAAGDPELDNLTAAGVVPLAAVHRSRMRESIHLGAAAVVGPDGEVVRALGDIDALIYPRSTLKFLQAITVLRSGVDLDGPELVLAAASHTGTAAHVEVVRSILHRAGLDESALQCPADWPSDPNSRDEASGPARITMNCSGKHAAFLLACVRNGWPIDSYLAARHPLQLIVQRTVEDYTGEPVDHTGIDGCGAPLHAVSLRGLARATGLVARGADADAERLSRAIRRDPWALDSPAVASVMSELGLIAKNGAEGVFVAGSPDGTAVALKIIDGSTRASIPVALALLDEQGVVDSERATSVLAATTQPVLGGGEPVGELIALV